MFVNSYRLRLLLCCGPKKGKKTERAWPPPDCAPRQLHGIARSKGLSSTSVALGACCLWDLSCPVVARSCVSEKHLTAKHIYFCAFSIPTAVAS